jgi:hypothetical protein
VKIDFAALAQAKSQWRGIGVTLFVNWFVKPFSMALPGWIFIRYVFAPWLPANQLHSYIAGLILLATAPCTAMVFVWSQLCKGDPYFTLSQVALNDSIMIVAFAPLVALLPGLSAITVPWDTLIASVGLYHHHTVHSRADDPALAAREGRCTFSASRGKARSLFDFRVARHACAFVCLSGRGHLSRAAGHCHVGGAHSD